MINPVSAPGAVSADSDALEIKNAAKKVEAIFLRELLRQMGRTSLDPNESGTMFGGSGRSTYQEMFYETLANHIADSGGFGLAELIARNLKNPPPNPTPTPMETVVKSDSLNLKTP